MIDFKGYERAKRAAEFSPGWSARSEAEPWVITFPGFIAGFSRRKILARASIWRPLRGLGVFMKRDPRVTLAALAHPGLNSAAGYAGSLRGSVIAFASFTKSRLVLGLVSEGGAFVHIF